MSGPSPDANLAELLSQWTHAFGWLGRPAFLCGDDVYTHGEVHRGASRVAAVLAARGAAPGDRVAIALPASIELVWAFLGAIRLGAVAALADPEAAKLPDADLTVCAPGRHPRTVTAGELTAGMPRAGFAPAHPVLPINPAFVRGDMVYAHGDPEACYLAMQLMSPIRLREDDVLLSVYDPAGLCDTILLPLFCGASAVLEPDLRSVSKVAEHLRGHRASVLVSSSSFLSRIAAEGETFGPLRVAISRGAAPPRRTAWRLGCPVVTP